MGKSHGKLCWYIYMYTCTCKYKQRLTICYMTLDDSTVIRYIYKKFVIHF